MSNRELPMMPWFPKEFAAATSTWSFAERSAYRALLDVQWEMGVLPKQLWRLAQAIGMSLPDFELVWPTVMLKFEQVEGGIRNSRLEEHRVTAFKLKQGRRAGAHAANAQRRAQRTLSDTHSGRSASAKRSAQRVARATPPSPSPSLREEHPQPPQGGRNGLTANGEGRKPREQRDVSLTASRQTAAEIDQVALTATMPTAQRLTWAHVRQVVRDPASIKAVEMIGDGDFDRGCRLIADRDRFNAGDIERRFREAYERLAAEAAH